MPEWEEISALRWRAHMQLMHAAGAGVNGAAAQPDIARGAVPGAAPPAQLLVFSTWATRTSGRGHRQPMRQGDWVEDYSIVQLDTY